MKRTETCPMTEEQKHIFEGEILLAAVNAERAANAAYRDLKPSLIALTYLHESWAVPLAIASRAAYTMQPEPRSLHELMRGEINRSDRKESC